MAGTMDEADRLERGAVGDSPHIAAATPTKESGSPNLSMDSSKPEKNQTLSTDTDQLLAD